MGVIEEQSAAIVIPADYLEDVRSALVQELANDVDALRTNQTDLATGKWGPEDRDASLRLLSRDVAALGRVAAAAEATELVAERQTLFHALEALCRLLTDRLIERMGYGPVDMGAVLDLTARLRWAAGEAARIYQDEAVA